jgi:hypothetical protein
MMKSFAKKTLSLQHATAYFRIFDGKPEMLLENGSQDGPAYVIGRAELEAVAEQIGLLLQHSKTHT